MNKKDLEKLGFTTEALEKAGLKTDVLDEIIVLHGKDIEKHKSDIETLQSTADGMKTQLDEANKAIEGFKAMDVDSVKKAADEWKAKFETSEAEAKKQLEAMKFDHALEGALKTAKAKDPADVIPHLKKDMLKLGDDGKFVGLEEQLKTLKESKDYLFDSETPDPKIITGGKNQKIVGDSFLTAAREAAGLSTEKDK